ncbi:NAD-dependent epimerase/dehydratase family protein [Glaciihabitans tibetensis]|uniref:NAD-dependent epimerase/dehydratase family protein n=1 Tax=Glaciihabitans tibetensis TaxID=1266600 RepID=UPI0011B22BBB|nr:NAD-dependent epimerase/dehydratase family protein [Glaciihabitans tibetensis]
MGYSGFVGGNLLRSRNFDLLVRSTNTDELRGQHFSRVVFSAAKAEKWRANKEPAADLAHIEQLEAVLSSFTTDELVIISTVDVYSDPRSVDESTLPHTDSLHPYGLHRLQLEQFARLRHAATSIVRLPALFGPGIKKNVIYDLMHDNNLDQIHHAGSFQYYNLERLSDDLDRIVEAKLPLVNITTAPLLTSEIAARCFGREFFNAPTGVTPGSYDVHTQFAEVLGGTGPYSYGRDDVLRELSAFVQKERRDS